MPNSRASKNSSVISNVREAAIRVEVDNLAAALEAYKAWRLLRTDAAHVFFKEIKSNGRVVAFKAKTAKAVENAKHAFCTKAENAEEELCFV